MNPSRKNNMDWVLHIAIFILITISIIFVYSAQFQSINEIGSIWFKQLIYAGLGIIIYFLTALLNSEGWIVKPPNEIHLWEPLTSGNIKTKIKKKIASK